ncbi:BglG family transcription antiterminator [Marinilactibacillus kalidii]|uniref:BglG family transcription antiterminator n=1 Tax=Marinilactibacillus kalidii TaxID=2820274 RepID=UPI001ABE268C|nr:PRD domain-containing protein [Marinilactibacillus kalidii]
MRSKQIHEQKLLLFLSEKPGFTTSEELASQLAISRKTVYRKIKDINESFPGGELILSEKGRGYRLDYEKYICANKEVTRKTSQFTPAERRGRVMEELLLYSPKARNINELYADYFVSETVIFNDEQFIAEELKAYNLKLVRRNRTVSILGEEEAIRKAITERIQRMNIVNVNELKNNTDLNFNHYDVLYILDQIKTIEKKLAITIHYPYDINIFSHLYILISRIRKVGLKHISSRDLETKSIENQIHQNDQGLYSAAETTIQNLSTYLNVDLPHSEVIYLYQYLMSSRMGSATTIATFSTTVTELTQLYLNEMSKRLNITIQSDSIFLDLANHIKPMLNRLRHGIRVKNSLLDQIQLTYQAIYNEVVEVSKEVSQVFSLPTINEDENGFLTLYFARIIETNQLPIRTVIMCTTGVGTSELLKVKIEKKFPELEIVDVIAYRNLREISQHYPGIELIVTTIQFEEAVPMKTLLVSAMFTEDDKNRLQKKIKEIYNER